MKTTDEEPAFEGSHARERGGRRAGPGISRAVVALVAALSSAGGCSFISIRPLPPPPSPDLGDCTRSNGAPILDIIGTAVSGATAAIALGGAAIVHKNGENEIAPSWNAHRTEDATPYLVTGLVAAASTVTYGLSTHYGFRSTSACRKATRARQLPAVDSPLLAPSVMTAPAWVPEPAPPPGWPPPPSPPPLPPSPPGR